MTNLTWLVAVAGIAALAASPAIAIRPGDWARYEVISSREDETPPVRSVTLTALAGPTRRASWRMDVEKTNGQRFAVWAVSSRYPLNPDSAGLGAVDRYIIQQNGGTVVEYREHRTGGPLLPRQPLEDVLLPTPLPPTRSGWPDAFLAGGTYLGHALARSAAGHSDPQSLPEAVVTLELDPSLTVGTSRNFKDNGVAPPSPDVNWEFVPLTSGDFDALIAAGHNYFIPTTEQLPLIINRPVFFVIGPEMSAETAYPKLLYRSNWWGSDSFYDEPATRFNWSAPAGADVTTPESIANAITQRARALAAAGAKSGIRSLERALRNKGVSLGTLELREPDVPIWETVYDSACYQMMGGAHALIHEGRYGLHEIENLSRMLLGRGLSATAEEELRLHFACLRGAARVFGGEWGTAIYGQCDPALRQPAMDLAYDMGASYIWFWTSDHTHHVPFREQIELARGLTRHRQAEPERDLVGLRRKADTAIVLPFGYTMAPSPWWQHAMRPGALNSHGAPFRSPAATALFEFLTALRSGADADIVVDHARVAGAGYRTLIRIRPDGTVSREGAAKNPGHGTLARGTIKITHADAEEAAATPAGVPIFPCADFTGHSPKIDGALDDWAAAKWIPLARTVYGQPPSSEADCSGAVAAGCDGEHLFIAARIRDDRHRSFGEGWGMWNGDCLQFALDTLGTRTEDGYDSDDYEIGFTLTADGPRAYCWESPGASAERVGPLAAGALDGIALQITRDDAAGETVYEASIPLVQLWPLAMRLGRWAGFNAVVNDADEGERVRAIGIAEGIAGPKRPDQFALLRLSPDEAPNGIATAYSAGRNVVTAARSTSLPLSAQVRTDREVRLDVRAEATDADGRRAAIWAGGAGVSLKQGLHQLDIALAGTTLPPGRYTLAVTTSAPGACLPAERFPLWVLPAPR